MDPQEWNLAKHLCNVLEVSYLCASNQVPVWQITCSYLSWAVLHSYHSYLLWTILRSQHLSSMIDQLLSCTHPNLDPTCMWQMLTQILKDTTQYFSHAKPHLAHVLPAMDHIHNEFEKYEDDLDIPVPIHSGMSLARKMLNQYYSKTDDVKVYHIAMSQLFFLHLLALWNWCKWKYYTHTIS